MIRLDCAKHASAICVFAALAMVFGATAAGARTAPQHHRLHPSRHASVPVPAARPLPDIAPVTVTLAESGVTLSEPTLSIISEDMPVPADAPSIVKPARHIYCVEFARLASGIALFGDARTWWDQARKSYAQLANPVPGAVMVFAARKKMSRGHVAVVKRLIGPREVLVDHANWGRDGKIYLNAPVVDVSPNNDWSQVRVWNTKANTLGATAYALKGFIAQRFAAN